MAARFVGLFSKFISSDDILNRIFIKQSIQEILKSFKQNMGNKLTFSSTVWKENSRKTFDNTNENYKNSLLLSSVANLLLYQKKDETQWNNEREVVNLIASAEMALRVSFNFFFFAIITFIISGGIQFTGRPRWSSGFDSQHFHIGKFS